MLAALLDPRNGMAYDLAPFSGVGRTYLVASTPRTGSTLLCRLLWDTGRVGAPKEYLNPMQLRDWEVRFGATRWARLRNRLLFGPMAGLASRRGWSKERVQAHLRRVRDRRTSPEGFFGLKLHRHHFERFFAGELSAIDDALAVDRWIVLRRADRVAQAVSWARALQSGRWAAHQRFSLPTVYRRGQISRLLAEIEAQEIAWDDYFAARDIVPLRLTYEELVADRVTTVRAVLGFLGVDGAEEVVVPKPDLEPQADSINASWIARYRGVGDARSSL